MIKPNELKKFILTLETLSPVSLSPRESYCFYKNIDDDKVSFEKIYSKASVIDKINILYTFYQYGEYEEFNPYNADYYVPGSSIKGALRTPRATKCALGCDEIYIDDAKVCQSDLGLRVINKLQFAKNDETSDKIIRFKPFFENVGVEMLNAGVTVDVTIYAVNKKIIEKIIHIKEKQTKEQLAKADEIVKELITKAEQKKEEAVDTKDWEVAIDQLSSFQKKLAQFEGEGVFFLGGYKGELFSHKEVKSIAPNEYQGTFYQDAEGNPFGLVKLSFKNSE